MGQLSFQAAVSSIRLSRQAVVQFFQVCTKLDNTKSHQIKGCRLLFVEGSDAALAQLLSLPSKRFRKLAEDVMPGPVSPSRRLPSNVYLNGTRPLEQAFHMQSTPL